MRRAWTISAVVIVCSGCSAYAAYHNVRATRGLAQAHQVDAATYAPYENTLAEEYLTKAREEASQSHYADAVKYAKRSQEMSGRAVSEARRSREDKP